MSNSGRRFYIGSGVVFVFIFPLSAMSSSRSSAKPLCNFLLHISRMLPCTCVCVCVRSKGRKFQMVSPISPARRACEKGQACLARDALLPLVASGACCRQGLQHNSRTYLGGNVKPWPGGNIETLPMARFDVTTLPSTLPRPQFCVGPPRTTPSGP